MLIHLEYCLNNSGEHLQRDIRSLLGVPAAHAPVDKAPHVQVARNLPPQPIER